MTARMEILQIERVVRHLVNSACVVVLGPHFEFNDQDDPLEDHDGIDTFAHARDRKFEGDPPTVQIAKLILEKRDLLDPGIPLEGIEVMRVPSGEVPEDGLWLRL
jgi:hypothetical protein